MRLFSRKSELEKQVQEEIREEEIKKTVRDKLLYEKIIAEELAGLKELPQANLLIITKDRGAEWLGTPLSFIVIDNFYYILFQPRPESFSDALFRPLGRLLGRKEQKYVLKVEKHLVKFNEESVSVFAEKLVHDVQTNIITVIAPAVHPVESTAIDSYEALLRERDILKEKLEMVLEQEKKLIELAMTLNPAIKLYKKSQKQTEEGEKKEDLFGFQLDFVGGDEK